MATLITNGKQTIKLYQSSNRGKPLYQLAYYTGGRRVQRNFADKAEAKRTANQVLGGMAEDSELVDNLATPELESLVAAKRVLASGYPRSHGTIPGNHLTHDKSLEGTSRARLCGFRTNLAFASRRNLGTPCEVIPLKQSATE
jgi:hypothetical protein